MDDERTEGGGAGARGRSCRPFASGRRWCSASPTSSPWTSPPTRSSPPARPRPCSTASARSPTSPRAATLSTSTSASSPRTGSAPGCSTPSQPPPPASGWRPASSSSRSAPPSSGGTRPRSSPSPPAQMTTPSSKLQGVDSSHDSGEPLQAAKALARSSGAVIAVSGAVDFITDGEQVISVSNGVAMMQKITATRCAVTGLIAAFVGAYPSDALVAAACALAIFGLAGEIGMESAKGPASLRMHLIDALYGLDEQTVTSGVKIALVP